jgi:hypothetical protein
VNLPTKHGGNKIGFSLASVSERGMIVPGPAPRDRERWCIQPITISGSLFGGDIATGRRRLLHKLGASEQETNRSKLLLPSEIHASQRLRWNGAAASGEAIERHRIDAGSRSGSRQTKTPPPPCAYHALGGAAFCLIMTRKEELLCPWQAWQRPTLPGLKP